MKIKVWQVECAFCGKKFNAILKEELEKIIDEHEKECDGIKKLRELYKIPIEDRSILFKILDESKKVDKVKKFMEKNKLSVDELKGILDEIVIDDQI